MNAQVKQFIEENIKLIENDKWSEVVYKAETWLLDDRFIAYDIVELWRIIRDDLDINIFNFKNMNIVPSYYYYSTNIEEIILPEHILHINHGAFLNCKKLKKVILPNSLHSIQQHAFSDTPNLTEIEFNGTLDEFNRIRLNWNPFGMNSLGRNRKKLIAKDGVINL